MYKNIIQHQYVDKQVFSYSNVDALLNKIDKLIDRAAQLVTLIRQMKEQSKFEITMVEEL